MLPVKHRLRKKQDIELVFAKGKNVFDPLCGARVLKIDLPETRFAVVVGTKTAKSAVMRNRLKRRVREIVHKRLDRLVSGHDVVLFVRSETKTATFSDLERHVDQVLTKAGVLRRV